MPRSAFRVVDFGDGLEKVLLRVNTLRYAAELSVEWTVAEEMLDSLFRTSNHFAVYGTLAPGAPNHHVLENLSGEWCEGCVHGDLHQTGKVPRPVAAKPWRHGAAVTPARFEQKGCP